MMTTTDLRYPIGQFTLSKALTESDRREAIHDIEALPARMRAAADGLGDTQLDTPYRPGGWTVRQVVHHVADSHMNGFIRVKLALTEERPVIKPYDENLWAGLPDARLPVDVSLSLLEGLHARWAAIYRALEPAHFERTFVHPELNDIFTIDRHLQLYAWHSRHHVAHVTALRQREGW